MSNHEITFAEWGRDVRRLENQAADFGRHERMIAARELLSSAVELMRLVSDDLGIGLEPTPKRVPVEKPKIVRKRPAKRSKPTVREESAEIEDDASDGESSGAVLRPMKRNNEWMRTLGPKLEERGIGAEITSHDLQAWGESTMQVASQRAKRLLDAGVLERLGRGAFRVVRYPEIG